jgi:tRNA-binding protein
MKVNDFPEARKPHQLSIDFGTAIGILKTSAQITNYCKEDLINRQIVAVVNFPKKQMQIYE